MRRFPRSENLLSNAPPPPAVPTGAPGVLSHGQAVPPRPAVFVRQSVGFAGRERYLTRSANPHRLVTALNHLTLAALSEARLQGGYEVEFVNPPEDLQLLQTKCPICLLVPRKPHMVTCCCHKFCESCIRQVNDGRGRVRRRPCPLCAAVTYSIVHEKDLERKLNSLKVHCSRQKDGCDWSGELGQLEEHLNETPSEGNELKGCCYVEIKCGSGCEKTFKRCVLEEHQVECSQRQHTCDHCKAFVSSHQDIKLNHWPQCERFPVSCPNNCGVGKMPRMDLGGHQTSCPLQVVPCEFVEAGCTLKFPRKKLAEHVKTNMTMHMSLLAQQNLRLSQQNVQLKQEVEDCKKRLAALEQGRLAALEQGDRPETVSQEPVGLGEPVEEDQPSSVSETPPLPCAIRYPASYAPY